MIKSSRRDRRSVPNSLPAVTAPVIDLWEALPIVSVSPEIIPIALYQLGEDEFGDPEKILLDPADWIIGAPTGIGYIDAASEDFIPATGTITVDTGSEIALGLVFSAPVTVGAQLVIPSWSQTLRSLTGHWLAGGIASVPPVAQTLIIGAATVDSDTVVTITLQNISSGGSSNVSSLNTSAWSIGGQTIASAVPVGPLPTNTWTLTASASMGLPGAPVSLDIPPGSPDGIAPFGFIVGLIP